MLHDGRPLMFYERTILAPATCPGIAWRDGEPYACGLGEWDHAGECVWFTPGQWPFPPILHPLDYWLAAKRLRIGLSGCPNGHGRLPIDQAIIFEPPPDVIQDQYGEIWRPDYDAEVEFQPCGCRFRL